MSRKGFTYHKGALVPRDMGPRWEQIGYTVLILGLVVFSSATFVPSASGSTVFYGGASSFNSRWYCLDPTQTSTQNCGYVLNTNSTLCTTNNLSAKCSALQEQGSLTCVMPAAVSTKICSYNYPKAFAHSVTPFFVSTHPGYSFYQDSVLFPNTDGNFTIAKNTEITRTDLKDTNATETSFNPSGVYGIMTFVHYRSDINGNWVMPAGSQIKLQYNNGSALNCGASMPCWTDLKNSGVKVDGTGLTGENVGGLFPGGPCSGDTGVGVFTCWNNSTSPAKNLLTFTQDPTWVSGNSLLSNIPGHSANIFWRIVGNSTTSFTANLLSVGAYIFRIQYLKYFINTIGSSNFSIYLVYDNAPAVSSAQEFNVDWYAIDIGCNGGSSTSGVDNLVGCSSF